MPVENWPARGVFTGQVGGPPRHGEPNPRMQSPPGSDGKGTMSAPLRTSPFSAIVTSEVAFVQFLLIRPMLTWPAPGS